VNFRQVVATLAAVLAVAIASTAALAQSPVDVGKHPPITILINSSPWYGGFEKVVQSSSTRVAS
jgi:multiple sugar transport system substrate-binding protein